MILRKIRITLAIIFFIAVSLLFLDFTGSVHAWLGWTAKIQFLPALLALDAIVVILLIVLTLLFGRIYCSIICPMGVMQDIISRISGLRKKKKYRFSYSKEKKWLRYGFLFLFFIALLAGVGSFVALLAPYSSFGRIAQNLFAPICLWGNNILAHFAERADSYAFYEREIWIRSIPTFAIATATFVFVFILAWRNGRTYCNTICPVGTILGFFSRWAWFKPAINTEKCRNCTLCSRRCKASCIDYTTHTIDYNRCVACMDCIDTCKEGAISYRHHIFVKKESPAMAEKKDDNTSRRAFIATSAFIATATALQAQTKKVDGGLAVIEDKKIPERKNPIVPTGAISLRNFTQHCTACQLCVSACPNGVLRPATELIRLMQPEMSYERGYCRPECTKCADVCPSGAISPISIEEKSSIQIGHAVWVKENCIPLTDGVSCGNCARHCPSGAIQMVPSDSDNPDSPKIPVVNEEKCIGCGTCENLCPARPFSAIYVEGNHVHRTI